MIIPGMEIPQSWNRFSYVGNNPITHNDPDGRCYPVCTALIGAGIGAITGAVIYAATITGDNFKWGELAVAAGAGALAGGLIGTGLGIVAGGAATTSMAAAVPYLLSSGSAVATSGASYMFENKNEFDSKDFVIQTSVSGIAAALTANPSMSLGNRWATNVIAAEFSYLLTEDDPTLVGGFSVGASATIATGIVAGIGLAAEEMLYMGTPRNIIKNGPLKNTRQGLQENVFGGLNGVITGLITPTANQIENIIKKYGME